MIKRIPRKSKLTLHVLLREKHISLLFSSLLVEVKYFASTQQPLDGIIKHYVVALPVIVSVSFLHE